MGKNRKKRMLALLLVFVVSLTLAQPNVQAAAAVKTKTVTSQAQLNAALKDKSVTAVTIKAGGKLTLTLKAGSALTTVTIAKKATVTMKGKSAKLITVENKAAGTVLKTSIPVALKNTKKMSATFLTGADGSTITAKAELNAKTDVALEKISKSSAKLNVNVQANAKSIGELRIAYNGDIYTSQAYKSKTNDTVWLPLSAVKKLTGKTPASVKIGGKDYASLSLLADFCVYDEALASLYVWTDMPVSYLDDESRIAYYGLGKLSDQAITFKEYFALLDQAVSQAEPAKLAKWKKTLPKARTSGKNMTRFEGAAVLLYAAAALGNQYAEFNADWGNINDRMGDKLWEEADAFRRDPAALERLPVDKPYTLGGFEESSYVADWDIESVASRYGFGRISLVNGSQLFDYDEEENSMHYGETLTVADAKRAIVRFLDSAEKSQWVSVKDSSVRQYNNSIITVEHLARAKTMPEVFGENTPVWNSINMGVDGNYKLDIQEQDLFFRKLSEYGFNAVRYTATYETFFDRRVKKADERALQELDALVALAMEYRIHLNLGMITLPGKWIAWDPETFTQTGEMDLFTNPERQKEAENVWDILAERYAGIPSSVLSFEPFLEPSTTGTSLGESGPFHTGADIASVYVRLIGAIRARDAQRHIVYDPQDPVNYKGKPNEEIVKAVTSRFDNVQSVTIFCEEPYVYAEMTDDNGAYIDAMNHGMFKPSYPATYYGVRHYITADEPLTFTGELVKGTKLNLYLRSSSGGGKLSIFGDKELLCEETLPSGEQDYHAERALSGYFQYAKSGKPVSIILKKDYKNIRITCDSYAEWSGIDVTLPDSYAVKRWYYDTEYDAFLEGREYELPKLKSTSQILISPYGADTGEITIHPDVRFTTNTVTNEASVETIDRYLQEIKTGGISLVMCELASFSCGTDIESALRYYGDFLDASNKYGIGYHIERYEFLKRNEWELKTNLVVGAKYTKCDDGTLVCVELLKLFQSHMEKPVKLN